MKRIIFDIETIGENFDDLDETTQHVLTRWIKRATQTEKAYQAALEDVKQGLGFSPYTGSIVAIGVLEADSDKGAVYFQAPGEKVEDFEEEGITYRAMDEKGILEQFWKVAEHAGEFVSFNGRSFDVPFMLARGMVHGVKPSKDLMSNRYLNSQKFGAKHIDLLDQLSYYGAIFKRPNLHVVCRALGVKSPKEEGVTGDDVTALFAEKKYLDIARYNSRDLFSTREVFKRWEECLR